MLAEAHVMQVIFPISTFQVGQVGRYRGFAHLERIVQLANGILQLVLMPRRFVFGNHAVLLFHQFCPTRLAFYGQFLIDLRHLFPQVAASGVNDKIGHAAFILIQFDEMVTSAQ